ncbi:MAG: GNAT family N-acetyltransferase [bacterium]|nr:GNAT family N-acetyltransferase [bacterium]MDZ4247992.1 GNAT family N-acetyltransferase [Patescibacteria group bacterium]
MPRIALRKVKTADKEHFARWWRDRDLLRLTSGVLRRATDEEVDGYFKNILENEEDHHFVITSGGKAIGHLSLAKRRNGWHETQIVIGEKGYRGKGYGSKAIKLLLQRARRLNISKIYLEVRPDNARAIRAYERCGFRKVRTVLHPKNKRLPKTERMEL